jgi:bifunctional enzyme CysN/CysC
LPIVIVGHVDHGKSTLIGRLLHDCDSLPEGKVEELRALAHKRGVALEWSFALDALQIERDQGITLDTTRVWFRVGHQAFVIIDAPGHKEFLKNMVTGAASADAAILVVDASEGVSEQTRRHAYFLHLLGIAQVVVAVNKMDLVAFARERFEAVADEVRAYLTIIGVTPQAVVPIVAREGDMVVHRGHNMAWWHGPTLVGALSRFWHRAAPVELPLRLPIQDVYRWGDKRILVGRIETGRLRIGDMVRFLPSGETSRIKSIEIWNAAPSLSAAAGQSIGVTLEDDLFVERGFIAGPYRKPPLVANSLRVQVFWLDKTPLAVGDQLTLRIATAGYPVSVAAIDKIIDVQDLAARDGERIDANEVAEIVLHSRARIVFDAFADNPMLGRAVLVRDDRLVGGCLVDGLIDTARANVRSVAHAVNRDERAAANGHRSGVLWLTGLSGAGKSTLSMALERRLFERGYLIYVLDGDNVRLGLNRDLGFGPDQRKENIRRVAELARLFADAGFLVVSAFISPYRADRENARTIVGDGFHEVHIRASLETCERRDPKGLYARARSGEIDEFTGISAPYEEPADPELVVDTETQDRERSLRVLLDYVGRHFPLVAAPTQASRRG